MRLRISARVADYLEGTGAAYKPEEDLDMAAIIAKIREGKTRTDGSTHIDLEDRLQLDDLRLYIENMAEGARQNLDNDEDRSTLAEYNAAMALLRKLPPALTQQQINELEAMEAPK
jgi:hypothetical protein